jgi:hypothetical protein
MYIQVGGLKNTQDVFGILGQHFLLKPKLKAQQSKTLSTSRSCSSPGYSSRSLPWPVTTSPQSSLSAAPADRSPTQPLLSRSLLRSCRLRSPSKPGSQPPRRRRVGVAAAQAGAGHRRAVGRAPPASLPTRAAGSPLAAAARQAGSVTSVWLSSRCFLFFNSKVEYVKY